MTINQEEHACSRCLAPVESPIMEGSRLVSPCCYEDLITEAEAERLREEFDEIAMEMAAERRLAA
jgi:hypothetical protein